MAFFQCNFHSGVLDSQVSMNVVLPQRDDPADRAPWPTLYLLHGLSDDHTAWARWTSVERYASDRGMAVVMPAGEKSFYTDMAVGPAYGTFIAEELPAIARSFFPLSDRREDTFVAGLSMGGYGAFRTILSHPEGFIAGGSFSGALDVGSRFQAHGPEKAVLFESVFGDLAEFEGSSNDLFTMARGMDPAARKSIRLYQCCGTEDFLYEDNVRFRDFALGLGFDLTYAERPGVHEWGFWDRSVRDFLDWLTGGGRGTEP